MDYKEFLHNKRFVLESSGFDIDKSELNPMLYEFQKDIEERMGENLFPPEQRKIFMFYDMLMDVNNQKISDEEYDFLLFEVTHFSDIITYSNVSISTLSRSIRLSVFSS